jgi:hypothetical protein
LDIEAGERVEGEIDHMIQRRHEQRVRDEGQRRVEELWRPSERAYFERLEEQERRERAEFHEAHANRLRNTMGSLIQHHEREAERYRSNGHYKEETA